LLQKFIETQILTELIKYFILVAERSVFLMKISCKIIGDIRSEYTGMSSDKQCLIIVAENLRFLIQHLMKLKFFLIKTAPKIKLQMYKLMGNYI